MTQEQLRAKWAFRIAFDFLNTHLPVPGGGQRPAGGGVWISGTDGRGKAVLTEKHAKALNSILSVGGLRAELAAIVRYAGQYAQQDEQTRWAVYERYLAEGQKVVEREKKSWRVWGETFSRDLLRVLGLN